VLDAVVAFEASAPLTIEELIAPAVVRALVLAVVRGAVLISDTGALTFELVAIPF
jgi:hypothetical protein